MVRFHELSTPLTQASFVRTPDGISVELLQEGERLELAMLMQGVGHVRIPVTVEWVLLSSFGHSAGLHIDHNDQTREIMASFVGLLQNNSRG